MNLLDCKGFKVAHVPTDSDIVNVRIFVNAGSRNEADEEHGVAHFLEHMFYKGTERRDFREINKITSKLGTANAYTSRHGTCFHITVLKQDFDEAVDVLFDMAFHASFPEGEFEKEKGVICEEVQMYLDDPLQYFVQVFNEHLNGTAFGHSILGSIQDVQTMTLEKLRAFRDQHYNSANMVIGITGNISEEVVRESLEKVLIESEGTLSDPPRPAMNYDDYAFHHNAKQSIIALAAEGITLENEIAENFLPDIFCIGLGGVTHSLLFERLREELGLCYYVTSDHSASVVGGNVTILSLLDQSNIELALEEIGKIVNQVKEKGFSDELLDICKRNYLFMFGKRHETTTGIGRMLDAYFAMGEYPLSDYISLSERRKKVEAVTNDQIIEFANRTLGDGKELKIARMTQTQ